MPDPRARRRARAPPSHAWRWRRCAGSRAGARRRRAPRTGRRSRSGPRSTRCSGLSTLLITTIGRSPLRSALPSTNLVCGIGPSAASTSSRQLSTIDRMRSTSPPKSAWPGVSTMLILTPFQTTEVHLARMVIPRSRSRSLLSMARSCTCWLSRKVPDCCSSRSTRVVLPWSTCAMIAMLRRSMTFARAGGCDGTGRGRCSLPQRTYSDPALRENQASSRARRTPAPWREN